MSILKTQVQIRKKVLGQSVPITFSSSHKQCPVADITRELCNFITKTDIPSEFAPFLEQPITLLGRESSKGFKMKVIILNVVLGMLEQLLVTEFLIKHIALNTMEKRKCAILTLQLIF